MKRSNKKTHCVPKSVIYVFSNSHTGIAMTIKASRVAFQK